MQQVMVACITISGKFSDTINSFLVYLLLFLPSMILSCDGSSAIFSFMTVKYIPQTPYRLFKLSLLLLAIRCHDVVYSSTSKYIPHTQSRLFKLSLLLLAIRCHDVYSSTSKYIPQTQSRFFLSNNIFY